jgi:hypothetical protein
MRRRLATAAGIKQTLPNEPLQKTDQRFQAFQLRGKVFAVTGGGRGLGLTIAEALVEAGGEGMESVFLCIPLIEITNHESTLQYSSLSRSAT